MSQNWKKSHVAPLLIYPLKNKILMFSGQGAFKILSIGEPFYFDWFKMSLLSIHCSMCYFKKWKICDFVSLFDIKF